MALQLVYTSAPRLLDAGRSGFGVVARSKTLPPLAANAIERFSKYANMRGTDRSRIVMTHRKVTIGSTRLHVLSRIRDSGSDHTGRTNHIAHHLIFSPAEIRQATEMRLTPADVFAQFAWLDAWEGAPKAFDSSADVRIADFMADDSAASRDAWTAATGQHLHARLLAWDGAPKTGAIIIPDGVLVLPLLAEALAECRNPWEKTFTTSLEPTDELAELDWVIATESDTTSISRVSSRTAFDLSKPVTLPLPPENRVAQAPAEPQQTTASQSRTLPPPDLSPRQQHVPARNDHQPHPARVAVGSAKTAKQRNKSKPWLLIGSGIAALLLLLWAAFVVSQKGKLGNVAADSGEKEAELVKRLVDAGENQANAESLARNFPKEDLPFKIGGLKDAFKKLGETSEDRADSTSKIGNFSEAVGNISFLEKLPPGSLSESLWTAMDLIRTLQPDDRKTSSSNAEKNTKLEHLEKLKKSLNVASESTNPKWLDDSRINEIYRVLWTASLRELLNSGDSETVENFHDQVKKFVEGRDQKSIPEDQLRKFRVLLDEETQKNYAENLKGTSPELMASLGFETPDVNKMTGSAAQDPEKPKEEVTPKPVELPKLDDEQWCIAYFSSTGFPIKLPKSGILSRILEQQDSQSAEFSFGGGAEIPVVKKGEYTTSKVMISFEGGNSILCTNENNQELKSPLQISFKNSNIEIHFDKWPLDIVENEDVFVEIKQDPKLDASYNVTLTGPALAEIADLRLRTIPASEVSWNVGKGAQPMPEGKTIIVYATPPSKKAIENPSVPIRTQLLAILSTIQKETTSKAEQMKRDAAVSKKKEKKEKKTVLKDSDHEKIWLEFGWKLLAADNETREWLEKCLAAQENSPKLNQIDKIGGDMRPDEKILLTILKDPKGIPFEPNAPPQIALEILCGKATAFSKVFDIKPADSK